MMSAFATKEARAAAGGGDLWQCDEYSVNGRVQFSGPIHRAGTYLFSTHNGDVTLTVPANTAADVSVATHGGSIEADFPVQVRGDIARRGELEFQLGAGGASVRIESFSGAIRLRRGR